MADKDYAWKAERAALENIRGEVTREVAPEIRAFQKAVRAERKDFIVSPNLTALPEFEAAEKTLLNATARALQERGYEDAQRTGEQPKAKDRSISPAVDFEVSIVSGAEDAVPLNTPTHPRALQGKAK